MFARINISFIRCLLLVGIAVSFSFQSAKSSDHAAFLGFDRNEYPGDTNLRELRKTFAYAGYWLNNPPGSTANTWIGKRHRIDALGFGFLVLFNGRLNKELGDVARAAKLGQDDARQAVKAAKTEGFPAQTIIFLDQEEGGRLLAEQKAYLFAWIDGVNNNGFRAGVYCSGVAAREASGARIVTAQDIKQSANGRQIAYWVTNDSCPPSPGCSVPRQPPTPTVSGIDFAEIWQYAQSPKRKDTASSCGGYNSDGNCYVAQDSEQRIHLDLNTAKSSDPSHGRIR